MSSGDAVEQVKNRDENKGHNRISLPEYCKPINTEGMAEIFACSESTIKRRIKAGTLIAKKDGRKWRIRIDQLAAEYVQKQIQR